MFTFEDGHVYEGPFDSDRMVEEDHSAASVTDDPMQPQLHLRINDLLPPEPSIAAAAAAGSAAAAAAMVNAGGSGGDDAVAALAGGASIGLGNTQQGMPSNAAAAARVRQSLEKAVLRYTSELKTIYKRYSNLDAAPLPPLNDPSEPATGADAKSTQFAMTLAQFTKLWQDCNMASLNVSLATVHRIFAAMRVQHELEIAAATAKRNVNLESHFGMGDDEAAVASAAAAITTTTTTTAPDDVDMYSTTRPILFREFVEGIAR